VPCTVNDLGIIFQLGHDGQKTCLNPKPSTTLLIFHLNKWIHAPMAFCGCPGAPDHHIQLLRAQIFPSTLQRIKSAFSFECLQSIHELNLQGKTTAYDYYQMILRRTDPFALFPQPVRSCLSVTCLRLILFLPVPAYESSARSSIVAPSACAEAGRPWS